MEHHINRNRRKSGIYLTVKKNENLSTVNKVTVYNAMSSFLDHPVLIQIIMTMWQSNHTFRRLGITFVEVA